MDAADVVPCQTCGDGVGLAVDDVLDGQAVVVDELDVATFVVVALAWSLRERGDGRADEMGDESMGALVIADPPLAECGVLVVAGDSAGVVADLVIGGRVRGVGVDGLDQALR